MNRELGTQIEITPAIDKLLDATEKIVRKGTILDRRGNIRCPVIENTIPPQLLRNQALLAQLGIFRKYPRQERPTAVMGASEPGDLFAATTGALYRYPTIVTSRIHEGPPQQSDLNVWYAGNGDDRVFIGGVPTATENISNTLAIRTGDLEGVGSVAVFYGLCRTGNDARQIDLGLKKLGVEKVHHIYAAAIDVGERSGIQQLIDCGISAFATVRYKGVDGTGKIHMSTEDRMRR